MSKEDVLFVSKSIDQDPHSDIDPRLVEIRTSVAQMHQVLRSELLPNPDTLEYRHTSTYGELSSSTTSSQKDLCERISNELGESGMMFIEEAYHVSDLLIGFSLLLDDEIISNVLAHTDRDQEEFVEERLQYVRARLAILRKRIGDFLDTSSSDAITIELHDFDSAEPSFSIAPLDVDGETILSKWDELFASLETDSE